MSQRYRIKGRDFTFQFYEEMEDRALVYLSDKQDDTWLYDDKADKLTRYPVAKVIEMKRRLPMPVDSHVRWLGSRTRKVRR